MDYRSILPETREQYAELWNSSKEFQEFSMKLYFWLDTLEHRQQLSFAKYKGERLKWAMWTCWAYYWAQPPTNEYQFSEDFSAFRRY